MLPGTSNFLLSMWALSEAAVVLGRVESAEASIGALLRCSEERLVELCVRFFNLMRKRFVFSEEEGISLVEESMC